MPTLDPGEREALIRKSIMLRKFPLEEAMTHINGPLYGLTEEVFSLQHYAHIWQYEDCMRLEYISPCYAQYVYRNDRTFIVETSIFSEGQHVAFGGFASAIEAAIVDATVCPIPDSEPFAYLFAAKAKSLCVVAENATLTIDGKRFNGKVMHYTAPVRYSHFTLYHERIGIQGEALGPSLEELIQIVESLRDLNGKAEE